MTLQMRPKAGTGVSLIDVQYAPARDIAYLYPNAVATVESMLYGKGDPAIKQLLRESGTTHEELADAMGKYIQFLNAAHQNPEESCEDVLDRVGFLECPAAARIALLFYLGTIMSGTFFKGIRDVTPLGEDSTVEVRRLMEPAERMFEYCAASRFGRFWWRLRTRLWPRKFSYTINGR